VLAIKMTVYRTSDDSALVPALIEAAERGKQACARGAPGALRRAPQHRLGAHAEESGAYGAMACLAEDAREAALVVRREGRACGTTHVGVRTTQRPSAVRGLRAFTSDRQIAADVAELFNTLTGRRARPSI
jgi:polyphosphate kinase